MEDESITHSGGFDFEEPMISQSFKIIEQNMIVRSIYLLAEGDRKASGKFQKVWGAYSPENMVQLYGPPSQVWISTYSGELGDRHFYDLVTAYDGEGTIIHYGGWLKRTGSNFRICPSFAQMADSLEIYLQSPNDQTPLEAPGNFRDPDLIRKKSKPIFEASGLDEEEFAELFAQSEGIACFDTPIEIWPEYFKP